MGDDTTHTFQFEGHEVKVHGKHGFVPSQAESGSAGYDLFVPGDDDIHMPFNSRRMIDTGVIVQTPIRLFLLMVPRSSTGTKRAKSVRIANTVGIIDPSYRGQSDTIKVALEREGRKREYMGTFDYEPSLTNSTISAQANKALGTPMAPETTRLVKISERRYDAYAYQETDEDTLVFEAGTRFVQIIFVPYARPELVVSKLEEFDGSGRGGFGSTGK